MGRFLLFYVILVLSVITYVYTASTTYAYICMFSSCLSVVIYICTYICTCGELSRTISQCLNCICLFFVANILAMYVQYVCTYVPLLCMCIA